MHLSSAPVLHIYQFMLPIVQRIFLVPRFYTFTHSCCQSYSESLLCHRSTHLPIRATNRTLNLSGAIVLHVYQFMLSTTFWMSLVPPFYTFTNRALFFSRDTVLHIYQVMLPIVLWIYVVLPFYTFTIPRYQMYNELFLVPSLYTVTNSCDQWCCESLLCHPYTHLPIHATNCTMKLARATVLNNYHFMLQFPLWIFLVPLFHRSTHLPTHATKHSLNLCRATVLHIYQFMLQIALWISLVQPLYTFTSRALNFSHDTVLHIYQILLPIVLWTFLCHHSTHLPFHATSRTTNLFGATALHFGQVMLPRMCVLHSAFVR